MCGIAGALGLESQLNQGSGQLDLAVKGILAHQRPRGPDAEGLQSLKLGPNRLTLGHNRLSIIDLSTGANQPMSDSSNRYWLSFNGEIYNYLELRTELEKLGHRFRTRGDSEVLLAAFAEWRDRAFEKFYGMFSFAIVDTLAQELWLCRDRFGVKPLFYSRDHKNNFYFASSGAALAKVCDLAPDLGYLAQGSKIQIFEDHTARTTHYGLFSLLAGHYLRIDLKSSVPEKLEPVHYYDFSEAIDQRKSELAALDEKTLVNVTRESLISAVSLRLRTDVPFALSLSGGLDSATVAALAQNLVSQPLTGFHFGHPDARESEGPLVKELCQKTGIEVEYIWPTTSEVISGFDEVLAAQEAPFGGLSIVAQHMVFRAAHRRGFKVLLGGQGGDEGFLGYRKFLLLAFRERAKSHWAQLPRDVLGMLPTVLAELPAASKYWRFRKKYFSSQQFSGAIRWPHERCIDLRLSRVAGLLERQIQDVCETSLPTLLRYEDRNSMSQSIESRLPFMDHRLLELGAALPLNLKVQKGFGKWIIREIIRGQIPKSISHARFKKGFSVNEARWIREGLGDHLRDELKRVAGDLADLTADGFQVETAFSNDRLISEGHTLSEMICLIWLGQRLSQR